MSEREQNRTTIDLTDKIPCKLHNHNDRQSTIVQNNTTSTNGQVSIIKQMQHP